MHHFILRFVICAALIVHVGCSVHRQSDFFVPRDEWQSYSTPEEAGFDSQKLEEAMAFVDSIDILPGADIVLVHRPNTYLWQRISYQQRRKLIQLVLDAKIGEPNQNPDLIPISSPSPSFKSLQMTEDEKNSYTGKYLSDGGKFPFIIDNIDGQLKADFGEGKVNLFKLSKDHFIIEDYNDNIYFFTDEEGKRVLISINTLIMDGDYYLENGNPDKAFTFYKKAEKYYGDDPRVITCLEDVRRLREKK